MRVWDIEFSYKVNDFLGAWNISVHMWLKYYVYLRLIKRDKKGIQLVPIISTFIVSAIWHGFYPGYYLFFLASGIMDYIFKLGSKLWVLFDWMPLTLLRVCLFALNYILCAYWGLCFVFLDIGRIHKFHSALSYTGHIFLGLNFLLLQYSGIVKYCRGIENKKLGLTSQKIEADGPETKKAK